MATDTSKKRIEYGYLSATECADKLRNLDYYDSINQKSLDYLTQKKGATVEEYIDHSVKQAREFSEGEKDILDHVFLAIEDKLEKEGLGLPKNTFISIAKTTMEEAAQAGGYTHDKTIFISEYYFSEGRDSVEIDLQEVLAHELFHRLTRYNPDFRKDMYSMIGFTVTGADFEIPQNVREIIIANPDVQHHDSYATFTINGEKKKCYLVFLADGKYENPGDSFFDSKYTGLVDIDDDTLYRCDEASDFYDVVGHNTDYCEDPEECLAENFSNAVIYGMNGPEGNGYETPEIIEKIMSYLRGLEPKA